MDRVDNPEEIELIIRNRDEPVVAVNLDESNSVICRICFDHMNP